MKQMEEKLTAVNQTVEGNTAKLKEIDRKLEQVDKKLEEKDDSLEKVAKKTEFNIYEELKERESRRTNVIIHGVGELTDKGCSGKDRLDWDKKSCDNIFRALELDMKSDDLKFCRRVGEKGDDPRPMVIGFYTEMERAQLLRVARKLDKTNYSDVNISADLTKRQRDEEKDMKKEAERRNTLLTETDKAKNWEWIVVGARGEKRLIKTVPREQPAQRTGEVRGRRGRPRGTRGGTARGGLSRGGVASGSNSIPISSRPEVRVTEKEASSEEEEEEGEMGTEMEVGEEAGEGTRVNVRGKRKERSGEKAQVGPPLKR
jgi:TFIIF-interacting CTD phosphatase-like protein